MRDDALASTAASQPRSRRTKQLPPPTPAKSSAVPNPSRSVSLEINIDLPFFRLRPRTYAIYLLFTRYQITRPPDRLWVQKAADHRTSSRAARSGVSSRAPTRLSATKSGYCSPFRIAAAVNPNSASLSITQFSERQLEIVLIAPGIQNPPVS